VGIGFLGVWARAVSRWQARSEGVGFGMSGRKNDILNNSLQECSKDQPEDAKDENARKEE